MNHLKHLKHGLLCLAYALPCGVQATPAALQPTILPPMVSIHAGVFIMGSTEPPIGDGSHNLAEGPPHEVRVASFSLAKYETTVAQFRQFVAATGYRTAGECWEFDRNDGIALKESGWDAPAHAPTDYHPVMCVSWSDAQAYVQWLARETGRSFRLPSEAEWEYAARAGSRTKYASGDAPEQLCSYANMKDRRFKAAALRDHGLDMLVTDCDDGAEYTAIVGLYAPNGYGLHDMMGNVAEWVADCQHPDYRGAPADGAPWIRGCEAEGDYFITRGGSYSSSRQVLRSAARGHGGRGNASSLGEGFRIAEDTGSCKARSCTEGDAAFVKALVSARQAQRGAGGRGAE